MHKEWGTYERNGVNDEQIKDDLSQNNEDNVAATDQEESTEPFLLETPQ